MTMTCEDKKYENWNDMREEMYLSSFDIDMIVFVVKQIHQPFQKATI